MQQHIDNYGNSIIYSELMEYMRDKPVISTHSHSLDHSDTKRFDLDYLLDHTYLSWCGVPFGSTYESRKEYLDKVRYKSYFVWLQKSIQEIYQLDEPLDADNWDAYSARIYEAHKKPDYHIDLLKNKCSYEKAILDAYWNPGDDNGFPELFAPAYRINMFLYGYGPDIKDHNGNNPLTIYDKKINDIDEYVSFMEEIIRSKKQQGCVALKSALAYDRGLDFTETSKEKAQRVLRQPVSNANEEDIKAFQDYVFYQICRIAAELDMPLQCHTGLGLLKDTNAMQMHEVISKNPDTKFVLFHCSFPWMDDISALLHTYGNVYPDLCWLPLLSPTAAKRMLNELIEVGTADKVCWGCDTWTSEESYGARMAACHVLASVLEAKINDGYLFIDDAKKVIDNVLYCNAKKLYKL